MKSHLAIVGSLALVALTIAGLVVQGRQGTAQDGPSVVIDFEAGLAGFDVRADSAPSGAWLELTSERASSGERALALRLRASSLPERVELFRRVGCTSVGAPLWSMRLFVEEALAGSSVRLFTRSGNGWQRSSAAEVRLQPGWNDLHAALGTDFTPPVDTRAVCELGLELVPSASPATLIVDDVLLRGEGLAAPPVVQPGAAVARVSVRASAAQGVVSGELLGFRGNADIAGDAALLERLRGAGCGRAVVSLYPGLGADVRWLAGDFDDERWLRALGALRAAGCEPVLNAGTTPPWFADLAGYQQPWPALVARFARRLNRGGRFHTWELTPYERDTPAGRQHMGEVLPGMTAALREIDPGAQVAWPDLEGAQGASIISAVELLGQLPAELPDPIAWVMKLRHRAQALTGQAGDTGRVWLTPYLGWPEGHDAPVQHPAWSALWAGLWLEAARDNVETLFYPYLTGPGLRDPARGHTAVDVAGLLRKAGVLGGRLLFTQSLSPELAAQAVRVAGDDRLVLVLANLQGTPKQVEVQLHGVVVRHVEVTGVAGHEALPRVTRRPRGEDTELGVALGPWQVAALTLRTAGLLATVEPAGAQAPESPRAGPWRASWIGAGDGVWRAGHPSQLMFSTEESYPADLPAGAVVLFDDPEPGVEAALSIQARLPEAEGWLVFSLATPQWRSASTQGLSQLTLAFKSSGAVPLWLAALGEGGAEGPRVKIDPFLGPPLPGGWRVAHIPLSLLRPPEPLTALRFEPDLAAAPRQQLLSLWLDRVALVP